MMSHEWPKLYNEYSKYIPHTSKQNQECSYIAKTTRHENLARICWMISFPGHTLAGDNSLDTENQRGLFIWRDQSLWTSLAEALLKKSLNLFLKLGYYLKWRNSSQESHETSYVTKKKSIWVLSGTCDCLVTWFCYKWCQSQITRQFNLHRLTRITKNAWAFHLLLGMSPVEFWC